ncbi:molybdopterin molybdotransferase MoeA [Endozoicomonas gorgoniicola]|uniref:Molybdopterin molybdenumtransferase n=1 Tax=Endozoicomonas gorgoniicola TaxID=1234144 RepID=A0ABT3MRG7_9GAMM|nr:molybdopterin molybdotransferase MoeA [Endozoicomonas gorgoniicola]MCW7551961.1 molybdopterin molybdotransferase MoeA [Endozoicomonas gorgoniicola]
MTDCCSTPGLMPLEQGLEKLRQEITPVSGVEQVALEDALDRVLAEPVISPVNVPSHNNSAMDGYALRLKDLENTDTLPLAGQSLAGHPYAGELPAGQCIRIMTGASVPDSADTVIMQEQVNVTDNGVQFLNKPEVTGNNVRLAGEDIPEGCKVFAAGHRVRAQDLGVLASLGVPEVKVFRRVKVALFSTGDELKLPGQSLRPGDIYDSNRFALKAMLKRLGIEVIDLGLIADDPEALRQAFTKADQQADVVITSGGVSVGDADFVKDILQEMGTMSFWKLAIKPGKPFAFGRLPDSWFIGLPGNPVSATITFQQLATPALLHLMGTRAAGLQTIQAVCKTPLKKRPGRREFQRGILSTGADGQMEVVTTGSQGSGVMRSMSLANCYIVLSEQQGDVAEGEQVTVQLFTHLLMN